MDAIPESLNAIGGLDWIHLVFLWLIIMSVQLSPMLRRALARISNAVFKTKFNTNGVTKDDMVAVKSDVTAINTRLDNHEAMCERRNVETAKRDAERDAETAKREDAMRNDIDSIKSDVSKINGNMLVMQTDIKWIGKSIGRLRKEESSDE